MAEKAAEWEKKVADAQDRADRVYDREVDRLGKQAEHAGNKEAREVHRVEHREELDADFARHHIDYLTRVVGREVKRVDNAYARVQKRKDRGDSAAEIERAEKHAARVENDADKHVARVLADVEKHLERDARAAAVHAYRGLSKVGLDEEYLDDKADKDAAKVEKADAKAADKAAGI